MKKLSSNENTIFAVAKGHFDKLFQERRHVEILRLILSREFAIDKVSDHDLYEIICECFLQHADYYGQLQALKWCFCFGTYQNSVTILEVMDRMLGAIGNILMISHRSNVPQELFDFKPQEAIQSYVELCKKTVDIT